MPPRLNFLTTRTLVLRPKTNARYIPRTQLVAATNSASRTYSSSSKQNGLPVSPDKKGPNTDPLPGVSEEAAAIDKVKGEETTHLDQGTPLSEVVSGDKDAQEKLPKVLQDQIKSKAKSTPGSKRSFSTYTARRSELVSGGGINGIEGAIVAAGTQSLTAANPETEITFENEVEPLPPMRLEDKYTKRYPAIIDQFVGLIMRDGKKAAAQTNVAIILNKLRTSPPPKLRADRPLLPGHPPPSFLPLNPILYLTLAVDSLAPLVRLRSQRGAAGGGAALVIPVPLSVRQRRRTSITWILNSASKKKNRISGKGTFALRVADEIIGVVEGRSGLWDRRLNTHKQGVANRINVGYSGRSKRRK